MNRPLIITTEAEEKAQLERLKKQLVLTGLSQAGDVLRQATEGGATKPQIDALYGILIAAHDEVSAFITHKRTEARTAIIRVTP